MISKYCPILMASKLSPSGRWVITWSVAPGMRIDVTVVGAGKSVEDAIKESRVTLYATPGVSDYLVVSDGQ